MQEMTWRGEVSACGDYNYRAVPRRRETSRDWINIIIT